MALVLASARLVVRGDQFVRAGKWLKGALEYGRKIGGAKLGILGLGRIGAAIGERAEAFKMEIVWHGPRPKPDARWRYVADLVEMAREVDFLVVASPGGTATKHLVSRTVMEALGPEGTLVNIARGSVVDERAMVELLAAKKLGAAALDVFEDEPRVPEALFGMDNVILQPHQGSATHATRAAMGQLVVDNLKAYFAGTKLLTPVV
jgi:lactate dehydrogenase-like 2-hydroxyacid dehydrogenase